MFRVLILASLCFSLGYAACPSEYTELYGYCYRVYTSSKNFVAAESQCVSEGGHLASIHDDVTENALTARIPYAQVALLGLQCTGNSGTHDNCAWTDGTSYDFDGFNGGLPIIAYGQCVTLSQNDGNWYSTACAGQQNSFICKQPIMNTGVTNVLVTYAPVTCPNVQLFDGYGTVYSPGFPISFPANTKCEYILSGPTGSRITVTFPYFNTDKGSVGISGSVLRIYNGVSGTIPIYTLSGTPANHYRSYNSSGNVMKLVFQTSKAPRGIGWQAEFNAIGLATPRPTTLRTTTAPRTTTRGLTANCPDPYPYIGMRITSSNYPSPYDANSNCNVYIQNKFGKVKLVFNSIDTIKDVDVLTIYDGGSMADPILGTVSGHYGRQEFIYNSTGSWLTVNFNVRSKVVTGGGWYAQSFTAL